MKKWEILGSEMVFDSKWYKVRKDHVRTESGKIFDDYYLGAQPDFINLVALFDNGELLLERQYKHGAQEISLETVGGVIEKGEDPITCARRELMEETGYEAENIELLGCVYENPTRTVSKTYLMLATGLKKSGDQKIDYNESEIEFERMPLESFLNKIRDGEIFCEPAISALFFTCMRLGLVNAVTLPQRQRKRDKILRLLRIYK